MITLADIRQLSGVRVMNLTSQTLKLTGVSTDSRTCAAGNLFCALRGESFDGHTFVSRVIEGGASAVIVDETWFFENAVAMRAVSIPFFCVPDTTKALGELARVYRKKFHIPIIAVGGSNGKTTTKEMIAAVLSKKYNVLGTQGNLNNHIGVPLMIFRLTKKHQIAVLELGTNHPGELMYLCSIVRPTHALVTNIGNEHLEFFGDLQGVAKEETELYRALDKKGCAFVNADDPYLAGAGKNVALAIHYGSAPKTDVRALRPALDASGRGSFVLRYRGKNLTPRIAIGIPGTHNRANGVAAAAVGLKFGVPFGLIAAALGECAGASKRMQMVERNGVLLLNDTYNANPDSVRAALATLKDIQSAGRKFVVLGDMLELGPRGVEEHEAIGREAARLGFEHLFLFGPLAKNMAAVSGLAGAKHFDSKPELISSLRSLVRSGDVVLVKGSRGMKMEDVVDQL